MKKINITLIMLLALALVFTGCRGEGGEDTTAPPAETVSPETTTEEISSEPVIEYNGSRGLLYEIAEDGKSAYLSGIGSCTDADITVASLYGGLPVTAIGKSAFYNQQQIKSITVPESVQRIEEGAFSNCKGLKSIVLHDGITFIGEFAFDYCVSLTSIRLPKGLTRLEAGVLSACKDLAEIEIPESVTEIAAGAFVGCTLLETVKIPASVKKISNLAFSQCRLLTVIDFGGTSEEWASVEKEMGWDYESTILSVRCTDSEIDPIGSIGLEFRTFADYAVVVGIGTCKDSEVIIPATYNGLPVTEIWDRAFYQVKNMTSVTIPEGVTYIESEAFLNCPDLREIHLPASLENVTGSLSIGFMNCSALEFIEIAESNAKYYVADNCLIEKATGKLILAGGKTQHLAIGIKSIGAHAFSGNLLLKSLNIPEGVTDIHTSAFEGCTNLASITLPKTLKTIRQSAFKGCTALTSIVIPDSVTEIYNAAFSDCKNLKDVTLSKNLTLIDSEAFKACAIESIEIPAGVKELGATFSECEKLKSVTLPESFERFVGHTFAGCTELESINLPENLNHLGFFTFKNCAALKELNFGGTVSEWNAVYKQESWNDDAAFVSVNCSDGEVKLYADAADGGSAGLEYKIDGYGAMLVSIGNCTDKNIVIAPTFGGMAVTRIDASAFSGCDFIESVVIPEGVTIISDEAFYLCKNLKKVTLPSTLDIIGSWAFANCEKLEKIAIPNGTMIIEPRAFSDCKKLEWLTLCEGLEQIQENAFMNCASIKSIKLPRGLKLLAAASFEGCTKLASVSYGGSTNEWSLVGKEGAEWNSEWYRGIPATKVSCTDGDVYIYGISESDAIEAARKFWNLSSDAVLFVKEKSSAYPYCYKIAYCEPNPIEVWLADFVVKREVFVDQRTGECTEVIYDYPNIPDVFLDVIFNREKFLYVEQTQNSNGEYKYTTSEALFKDHSAHNGYVFGLQTLWYYVSDIDGDSIPELIFPGSARSHYGMLFRVYEGKVYGYACILDGLHTDATYFWHEQAGNYRGRSQVYFDGIFYKSRRLTEYDINDPNNIIYYVEGKETTKEKYEEFESAFSNEELESFQLDYYPLYVNPFPGG